MENEWELLKIKVFQLFNISFIFIFVNLTVSWGLYYTFKNSNFDGFWQYLLYPSLIVRLLLIFEFIKFIKTRKAINYLKFGCFIFTEIILLMASIFIISLSRLTTLDLFGLSISLTLILIIPIILEIVRNPLQKYSNSKINWKKGEFTPFLNLNNPKSSHSNISIKLTIPFMVFGVVLIRAFLKNNDNSLPFYIMFFTSTITIVILLKVITNSLIYPLLQIKKWERLNKKIIVSS